MPLPAGLDDSTLKRWQWSFAHGSGHQSSLGGPLQPWRASAQQCPASFHPQASMHCLHGVTAFRAHLMHATGGCPIDYRSTIGANLG